MDITFSGGKGPLSPERLARAEVNMGVTFPAGYREFMLVHNGGKPSRREFVFAEETGPYTDSSVRSFYPIEDSASLSLEWHHKILCHVKPPRIPRDMIPIGGDSFGNQICIGISGPRCGHVYFWDHEKEDDDEPTYGNMHLIARSFSEFLAKLT